jgi:ribose-phosphate pyrophosphokinase
MTAVAVQAFPDQVEPARALANALGAPFGGVALHRFPDGEVMPIAPSPARCVIAYASLDRPNEKLIALLLAADAWRRQGVKRLVLVAPYLCYMRQDAVFRPGEPLSRDVICGLLGDAFDRVVTVDAHMHRTQNLSAAFGGIEAQDLSAAEPLAQALAGPKRSFVIGPDVESEPWVRRVAERLGGEVLLMRKLRSSDNQIKLHPPELGPVRGRPVILVDDICSSGATLVASAELLRAAGAESIDVGVVHALFDARTEARLKTAGARRIVSTDAVVHPTNGAPLAGLLAGALKRELKG